MKRSKIYFSLAPFNQYLAHQFAFVYRCKSFLLTNTYIGQREIQKVDKMGSSFYEEVKP